MDIWMDAPLTTGLAGSIVGVSRAPFTMYPSSSLQRNHQSIPWAILVPVP